MIHTDWAQLSKKRRKNNKNSTNGVIICIIFSYCFFSKVFGCFYEFKIFGVSILK